MVDGACSRARAIRSSRPAVSRVHQSPWENSPISDIFCEMPLQLADSFARLGIGGIRQPRKVSRDSKYIDHGGHERSRLRGSKQVLHEFPDSRICAIAPHVRCTDRESAGTDPSRWGFRSCVTKLTSVNPSAATSRRIIETACLRSGSSPKFLRWRTLSATRQGTRSSGVRIYSAHCRASQ
jgi:hypothetical protein